MQYGSGLRRLALTTRVFSASSRTKPPAPRQTAPGANILGHSDPEQSPPTLPKSNKASSAGRAGYPFTLLQHENLGSRLSVDHSRPAKPVASPRAADVKRPKPGPLVKQDEKVLKKRLKRIILGLRDDENTGPVWKAYISSRTAKVWAGIILPLMPNQFKHMLAGDTSPQPEDLATLPWTATNRTGVYATILEGGPFHAPSPGFSVRLASVALAGGLREQWSWAKDSKRRTGLVFYEDRHRANTELKAKRRLVELYVTKQLGHNQRNNAETRRLVQFAEAIIAAWLGAPSWMTTTCSRSVLDLSPWNPLSIERESQGDHSYHPLAQIITLETPKDSLPPATDKPVASTKRSDLLEPSKDNLFHKTDKSAAPNRASKIRHSRLSGISKKTNEEFTVFRYV